MRKITAMLVQWIFKLLRNFGESVTAKRSPGESGVMKRAIQAFGKWVEDKGYCISDLPMEELCSSLGISKYELSWLCRSVYGDNFLTVRKKMRIREAERLLLEDTKTPFSYIGEMVGIPDRTNFRRQFFEVTGQTPGQYRAAHSN